MKQKNTKELDDILGKTHISDFDKFCVEQKGSMDPEQNAFSEYIKDLLKEKRITQQMVFLKADIPEKYGYKLLSGEKHTRQRDNYPEDMLCCRAYIRADPESIEKIRDAAALCKNPERCFSYAYF